MIRLIIVDDQKILLEGLKKIFEGQRHIEVVSTLSFSELVEPACNRFRPDAVLLDICMEGKNSGIALTRRLKKKYPGQKVIIMTGFQDVSFIEMARDAGADSFIYKESAARDFIDCLERTLAGEHLFPDVREKVTFGACHISLTDRERISSAWSVRTCRIRKSLMNCRSASGRSASTSATCSARRATKA